MKDKTLSVSAIQEGTVIDHIPANSLFDVINILKLDKLKSQITFGSNFLSKQLGRKAIVKIEGKFFSAEEINRISLVAPQAKLNIIHDYSVTEKHIVEVPDTIEGIAKCMNPKCITNNENVSTKFKVVDKQNVALKCHYCEKITDRKHLEIL
ncbi:MAG: aspartate carbamoyltransferase regulatory subunit [Salinivirgaceae bacterium]|nr:aspartate carbamoyltransferase regulatory subunit [Salinivirgaceae bacterium]MDD4746511.1 aspartate carbamoyltransferase regulatory subunit [Salinivirgaceae bacterium]MDY0281371.1 aspartate carbamoyltransferase regulatory subunit [Salinivirgaceae bacterium]